jgi:hypothetical protein
MVRLHVRAVTHQIINSRVFTHKHMPYKRYIINGRSYIDYYKQRQI